MAPLGRPRRLGAVMFDAIARAYEREPRGGHVPIYDLVHLRRFFGRRRAHGIQPPLVVQYQLRRRKEGASTGTINDETQPAGVMTDPSPVELKWRQYNLLGCW